MSQALFPLPWTVDVFFVARARQQVRVARGGRVGFLTSGDGRVGDIDVAVGTLRIVAEAPPRVIHRVGLLGRVHGARGRAPLPAFVADVRGAVEIVELDNLLRQG